MKTNFTLTEKNNFFKTNERLIREAVSDIQNPPAAYNKLYELACIGVTKALNTFDEARHGKLTDYAVECAKAEIAAFCG